MINPRLLLLAILAALSTGCAMLDSEAMADETSTTCIVEQHDLETRRLVARLVFVPAGLLTHRVNCGAHNHTMRRNTYDRAGRLIRTRLTWDVAAGEPVREFSWRRNTLPIYESDVLRVAEGNFEYGPNDKVIRATVELTTTTAETVHHSTTVHTYIYDESGRKIAKKTAYGPSNGVVTSKRVDYTYGDEGRLKSRKSTSFEAPSKPRSSYRTTFSYDSRGNLTEIKTSGSSFASKREYDANDRLVSLGSGEVFTWDESDRLVRSAIPKIEADYTYDDQGRLDTTRFDRGGSITTTYSKSCPSGFADPAFTPNVDGFLYYEGRNPTLRLW
jgi:hypothetical protein